MTHLLPERASWHDYTLYKDETIIIATTSRKIYICIYILLSITIIFIPVAHICNSIRPFILSNKMSQFSIQDATPKDVPDMVSCFFAAFKNDILVGNLDKNVDPQVRDKKLGNWMTGLMKEAEQGINGTRFFKAVDEKGLVYVCLFLFDVTPIIHLIVENVSYGE